MFTQLKHHLGLMVLGYLRFWAKLQLKKNPRAVIIGITGSAGKTSTRLAVVQLLRSRGVVKHSVHANSESGIPLNILGLSLRTYSYLDWLRVLCLAPLRFLFFFESYDYYVVELGIDSPHPPKNMSYLLSIIRPDIGVVLGASHAHAAAFDSLVKDSDPKVRGQKILHLIAQQKMLLAQAIPKYGSCIINLDSPPLTPFLGDIRARLLTIGHAQAASLRILKSRTTSRGFTVTYSYQNALYKLTLPDVYGPEYALTFAAALGVGLSLGVPLRQGLMALRSYRAPAGRLRLFPGLKQTHIIDSSYNSSPLTLDAALLTLDHAAPRAKHLVILGDMNELGSLSKTAHQALAKKLSTRQDTFILYGEMMSKYVAPYLKRAKKTVYNPDNINDLLSLTHRLLQPNLWILVKGSQNKLYLERVVASLLAHKADITKLARRGPYWDKVRALSQRVS